MIGIATRGRSGLLRRPMRAAWQRRGAAGCSAWRSWPASRRCWPRPRGGFADALATISDDRALNEIAANGYYSFFMALLGTDAPYEGLYATRPQAGGARAAAPAARREPAAVPAAFAPDSTLRRIQNPGPPRRINVVVVLEESLGSEFIGALHPPRRGGEPDAAATTPSPGRGRSSPTPSPPATGRSGAIEATTSSLPPLPGESIVRRDQSVDLFTLPELLRSQGYQTMFVYGGRALFDGMGKYLSNNGVDTIVDQGDFPDGTFTTAWGVGDEAIFTKALEEMDQRPRHGQAVLLAGASVSNHRPFTFPQDQIKAEPRFHRRENVVRYADYALGRFMREAKSTPSTGTRCSCSWATTAPGSTARRRSRWRATRCRSSSSAPACPAGARLDTLASSLDVPPTILGILGIELRLEVLRPRRLPHRPRAGPGADDAQQRDRPDAGDRMAVLGLHESATLYDVDLAKGEHGEGEDARRRRPRADRGRYRLLQWRRPPLPQWRLRLHAHPAEGGGSHGGGSQGRCAMREVCSHLDQIKDDVKPNTRGCEECLKMGDTWVHLRLCLTCGHVGCCDSSKNKHATKHFHASNTPSCSRSSRARTGLVLRG